MSDLTKLLRMREIFEDLDRHRAEQYIAVRIMKGLGVKKKDRDELERVIWGRASSGVPDFERALHIFQFLLEKKCSFNNGTYDAGVMFGKVSEKDDVAPKLMELAGTTNQPIFLFAAPDSSKYCFVYFVFPEKSYSRIRDTFLQYKYAMLPVLQYEDGNKLLIKQEVEIFAKQIGNPFQLMGITAGPGLIHASYAVC